MYRVPVAALAAIEAALVGRVLAQFALPLDTVLYDATNFFTFLTTTTARGTLPARATTSRNATTCSKWASRSAARAGAWGCRRSRSSIRSTAAPVPTCACLLTCCRCSASASSRSATSQRALITKATPQLAPLALRPDETVQVYRTRRLVWGAECTLVVLVSPRLQQGQRRGVEQHVASAVRWLDTLQTMRARATIEAQVAERLRGQHLREILTVTLDGSGHTLTLAYTMDRTALDRLEREWFGRLVLMTDQHDWTTTEIIGAYRG